MLTGGISSIPFCTFYPGVCIHIVLPYECLSMCECCLLRLLVYLSGWFSCEDCCYCVVVVHDS